MEPAFESRTYVSGRLVDTAATVPEACRHRREHGGVTLFLLDTADAADLDRIADELALHAMAVEGLRESHGRATFDRYGDTAFVVLRPARYADAPETVELGELRLVVGRDFTVAVRHGPVDALDGMVEALESRLWLTERGGLGVLYAALDAVVDGYRPVLDGLEDDVDQIEDQVFGGEPTVARRIYQLSREAIALHRAVHPLHRVLARAGAVVEAHPADATADPDTAPARHTVDPADAGATHGHDTVLDLGPDELRARIADVWSRLTTVTERVDAVRSALDDIFQTNATLVSLEQSTRMAALAEAAYQQDQQVRRISSWAAILVAPSLLAAVYGMDFAVAPDRDWAFAWPTVLLLMLALAAGLYVRFKRIGWL